MKKKQSYSHIIWDWNGTLFDDVSWCIEVINSMLVKRGLNELRNVSEYRNAFCFPIIQYYRNVGFDFSLESFNDLATEYIFLYHSNKSGNCNLYPGTDFVLASFRNLGITQTILSASEKSNLLSQMSEFNIMKYFDEVLGLSDIYAKSKVDIGLDYINRNNIDRAILVGDTKHDYEVANSLVIECVLIPNGHQNREMLLTCEVPVLEDISCVVEYIKSFTK